MPPFLSRKFRADEGFCCGGREKYVTLNRWLKKPANGRAIRRFLDKIVSFELFPLNRPRYDRLHRLAAPPAEQEHRLPIRIQLHLPLHDERQPRAPFAHVRHPRPDVERIPIKCYLHRISPSLKGIPLSPTQTDTCTLRLPSEDRRREDQERPVRPLLQPFLDAAGRPEAHGRLKPAMGKTTVTAERYGWGDFPEGENGR